MINCRQIKFAIGLTFALGIYHPNCKADEASALLAEFFQFIYQSTDMTSAATREVAQRLVAGGARPAAFRTHFNTLFPRLPIATVLSAAERLSIQHIDPQLFHNFFFLIFKKSVEVSAKQALESAEKMAQAGASLAVYESTFSDLFFKTDAPVAEAIAGAEAAAIAHLTVRAAECSLP